jgi:hypothetical protein
MTEQYSQEEMNKAVFINFVMMLGSTAMQQMGKIINPMTKKAETNLEAAQATIDMLVMLEAKTKGNLDADEQRMLKELLRTLQLNYVETSQMAVPTDKPATESAPEAPATDTKEPEKKAGESAEDKRKYHKSYGEQ